MHSNIKAYNVKSSIIFNFVDLISKFVDNFPLFSVVSYIPQSSHSRKKANANTSRTIQYSVSLTQTNMEEYISVITDQK